MNISGKIRNLFMLMLVLVSLIVLAPLAMAQAGGMGVSKSESELGFKIGKLVLHPGFSVQNIFDSNVANASSKYDATSGTNASVTMDDIIHIIGSFKLNYPAEKIAVTVDLTADYSRYLGIEDSSTKDLSAFTGKGRFSLAIFPKAAVSFSVSDSFTRAISPQNVGLAITSDRIHNTAKALLSIKPGGGQLRFFVGYDFDWEKYDDSAQANQNWMEHKFKLDWELEFLPKTAVFMKNTFALRKYYDFDPLLDNNGTNTASPDAMPFTSMIGVMGRVTSKLLINVSAGYGNNFSENFDNFNSVIAKVELTGQFTERTTLKGGYERSQSPVTSFSWTANNKIYLEFKQWLVNKKLKLYFHSSYNFVQYGTPDAGIDLDEGAGFTGLPDRSDRVLEITPKLRYDFLAWFYMELGYTFSWRDTDYALTRTLADGTKIKTFYDYKKHEILFGLTIAY